MKTKILTVIFIALFILSIWTVSCSAYTVTYNNQEIDFGDITLTDYVFVVGRFGTEGKVTSIDVYCCVNEPYVWNNSNSNYSDVICFSGGYKYYYCYIDNAQKITFKDYTTNTQSLNFYLNTEKFNYELISNSFDIKDRDGNVVFPKPVLTLAEVLEEAKPVETFQITMSGIIISLTAFLVGLVAFWKAWSFLSKNLRKA